MKAILPKNVKSQPISPTAKAGDSVFFHHEKLGAHSGKVIASGKHGATVKDDDGKHHKVYWHDIKGHKARKITHAEIVDKGEDGYICKGEDGKRFFVQGDYEDFGEDETVQPKKDGDMAKCLILFKRN